LNVARDPPGGQQLRLAARIAGFSLRSHRSDAQELFTNERSTSMKVKELMTTDVKRCSPDTNLAAAAKIMWEGDCGAVPVTDENDRVIGIITDRDICIAAATRPRTEGEIPAKELISNELYTCTPDDEVRAALGTMKARKVRRLPVVDRAGRLVGIVSIHDIAVQSRSKGADVAPDSVLDAFIAITAPAQVSVTA
jgi:CBS domain-containing protein